MVTQKTAALILIGNEILSGRTQDKNLNYIAKNLNEMGIQLHESRVVRDIEELIVSAVNELQEKYDYVFTTGGIGPTHDDITSASVAKALGKKLIREPEAVKKLEAHYEEGQLNEARLKMAEMPEGSILIENPITSAPGYKAENIFVLAGVPKICQAMFEECKPFLDSGYKVESYTISTNLREGDIALKLGEVQEKHPNIDIGSYPYFKEGGFGVSLVLRTPERSEIKKAAEDVRNLINELGGIIEKEE